MKLAFFKNPTLFLLCKKKYISGILESSHHQPSFGISHSKYYYPSLTGDKLKEYHENAGELPNDTVRFLPMTAMMRF